MTDLTNDPRELMARAHDALDVAEQRAGDFGTRAAIRAQAYATLAVAQALTAAPLSHEQQALADERARFRAPSSPVVHDFPDGGTYPCCGATIRVGDRVTNLSSDDPGAVTCPGRVQHEGGQGLHVESPEWRVPPGPASWPSRIRTHPPRPALDLERVFADVEAEAWRGVDKHGEQLDMPHGTARMLDALAATTSRFATDSAASQGRCTWRDVAQEEIHEAFAETDPAALRAELVQATAVLARWIRKIDLDDEAAGR